MNKKNIIIYALSFIIPIVFVLLAIIPSHIFPFGNNSFIYWDLELEYVNHLGFFKSLFTSDNNILYNISRMGGEQGLDFAAYYLMSPFNFLAFLFPDNYLNFALQFILMFKIGCFGLMFSILLNRKFGPDYKNIIFSIAYALCSFNLLYISNVVILDGILFLPLIILGIYDIVDKNKYMLYIVSSVLVFISNAYAGYVCCGFALTFFIYQMFLKDWKNHKENFSYIKNYFISTLLVVGLCAILIVPVKMALAGGRYDVFGSIENLFTIRTELIDAFSKMFTRSIQPNMFWAEKMPYIYIGILPLLTFLLYFFNKAFSRKERIVSFVYFAFLFAGFVFNLFFVIWNMGMSEPNGTIFRFGFVFSFFTILLAYQCFMKLSDIDYKALLGAVGVYAFLFILVYRRHYVYSDVPFMIWDFLLILLAAGMIYLWNTNKLKPIIALSVILVFHYTDVLINTEYTFSSQRGCCIAPKVEMFINNSKDIRGALQYIRQQDKAFYRIESEHSFVRKNYDLNVYNNMPVLYNYDALSQYSTCGKVKTKIFLSRIGMLSDNLNAFVAYKDTLQTYPMFLMGVKYLISSNENLHKPYQIIKTIKSVDGKENIYVYRNPYALPLGFLGSKSSLSFNDDKLNILEYQNALIKKLSGVDYGDIYSYTDISSQLVPELQNFLVEDLTFEHNLKTIPDKNMYYILRSEENKNTYFHQFFTNDELYYGYTDLTNTNPMYIGNYPDGKEIKTSFVRYNFANDLIRNYKLSDLHLYVVSENLDILKKYYDKLASGSCNLEKVSSSHLKGHFNSTQKDNLMVFTIPYSTSWTVKIDNKKVDTVEAANQFLAVNVPEGEHNIELSYMPKGLILGILISLFSLICLLMRRFDLFSKIKLSEKTKIYSLSVLIPLCILGIVFALLHISPFGNNSFILYDGESETLNYMMYLKKIIASGGNFFYSFEKSGGSGIIDFATYYGLFSPLNFILFLFPDNMIAAAYQALFILKMLAAGFMFNYLLNKIYPLSYKSLIFSTAYAIGGYSMMNLPNILFYDAIVLLPLSALGIMKIMEERKAGIFILSLFLSFIVNPYTCYISTLFLCLFFIYQLYVRYNFKEQLGEIKDRTICFVKSLLLSFGLMAAFALPIVYTLFESRYAELVYYTKAFHFNPMLWISQMFTGMIDINTYTYNVPFMFLGILILYCIILYFYNDKISDKKKIASFVFLLIMYLSFSLLPLHTVWNAMISSPYGFIYRYSYVFTFFILFMAYEAFINIEGIKKSKLLIPLQILLFFAFVLYMCMYQSIRIAPLNFDAFLIIIYFVLMIILLNFRKTALYVMILIAMLQFTDLGINAYYNFDITRTRTQIDTHAFDNYMRKYNEVFGWLKNYDKSFYRTESNDTYFAYVDGWAEKHNNMSLLFGYNGISHYGNFGKLFYQGFMRQFGAETSNKSAFQLFYPTDMPMFSDAFWGIKYIVTNKKLDKNYPLIKTFVNAGEKDIYVYKNPYALPLAFCVNSHVKDSNGRRDLYSASFYNFLVSRTKPVDLQFAEKVYNAQEYLTENKSFIQMTLFKFKFPFESYNGEFMTLDTPEKKPLDIYSISLGDKKLWSETSSEMYFDMVQMPKKAMNDYVSLIYYKYISPSFLKIHFMEENENLVSQYFNSVMKNKVNVTKVSSSHLKIDADIKENEQFILITLPYETDWHIKLDGKRVKQIKVFDAIMAIPVYKAGKHTIDMRYVPNGTGWGILISIASLFALIYLLYRKEL